MCIKPLHVLAHDGAKEKLPDDPDLSFCGHSETEDAGETEGEGSNRDQTEVQGMLLCNV